jgi:hypothetical protein
VLFNDGFSLHAVDQSSSMGSGNRPVRKRKDEQQANIRKENGIQSLPTRISFVAG